ncbi:MAG: polysaccharide deacetylase family protein, partial [Oscillospiraceae bacterium]
MSAIKRMISAIMTAAVLAVTGCGGTADNTAEKSSETAGQTSAQTTSSAAETKEETTVTRPERPTFSKDDKVIALTFDDGPNLTTTTAVLNKLEEYDIVASFFLV